MSDRGVHETGDGKLERDDQDRIARAVFADAEAMGVSDRKVKERVTREMIRRLEQQLSPHSYKLTPLTSCLQEVGRLSSHQNQKYSNPLP